MADVKYFEDLNPLAPVPLTDDAKIMAFQTDPRNPAGGYKTTALEMKDYVNAGKSGGKTIQGGIAASENLILDPTSHATKGVIEARGNIDVLTHGIHFDAVGNDYLLQGDAVNGDLNLWNQTSSKANILNMYTKDGDGTDIVNVNLYRIGNPSSPTPNQLLEIFSSATNAEFLIRTKGSSTVPDLIIQTDPTSTVRQLVLEASTSHLMSDQISNDANPFVRKYEKSRLTSALQNNDEIVEIRGEGYDGSNHIPASAIKYVVDGAPSLNDMPGRIEFYTTAAGASTLTKRFEMKENGLLRANTASYEALVTADNDIVNKKYVDTHPGTTIWDETGGNVSLQTLSNTVVLGDVGISTGTSDAFEIIKNSNAILSMWTSSNTADHHPILATVRTRGTLAGPQSTVQNTDPLSEWRAWGYNGTNYIPGGEVIFSVDGTPTATTLPTKYEVYLQDGVTSMVSTLRLDILAIGDARFYGTGALTIQSGTTAERPSSPINGMRRYNTSLGKNDFYENGGWVNYLTESLENLWDIESSTILIPHTDANSLKIKNGASSFIHVLPYTDRIEVEFGGDTDDFHINRGTENVNVSIHGTSSSQPLIHTDAGNNRIGFFTSTPAAGFLVDLQGNIQITGDISSTGTRAQKIWATNLEVTNMPTVGGASINANGVLSLTSAEVTQLANIDATTISTTQWGYLGGQNQSVSTGDTVSFAQLTIDNLNLNGNTISSTSGDISLVPNSNIVRIGNNTDTDFQIIIDGDTRNGEITWREDESEYLFTQNTSAACSLICKGGGTGIGRLKAVNGADDNASISMVAFATQANIETGNSITKLAIQKNNVEVGANTSALLTLLGDIKQRVHTDNVSNPPTDTELDVIFGIPATVGAGFTAYIDDNGAGTNFYYITTNGASWFYTLMAKAI